MYFCLSVFSEVTRDFFVIILFAIITTYLFCFRYIIIIKYYYFIYFTGEKTAGKYFQIVTPKL